MEENLKRLEKFFKYNLEIKEILHNCVFINTNDDKSLTNYKDRLYQSLKNIEYYLIQIIEMFFYSERTINNIKYKFKAYYKSLETCSHDKQKLKNFYKIVFSNIDEQLLKKIGENYCGYYQFRDFNIIEDANTINELLHVFHHMIVNNENYYQNLPQLTKKENNQKSPIILYGHENPISRKIYNNFPIDLECGWTDILSLDNKVLMMIRDRGHALTIEIDKINNDEVIVKYYIPKICNINIINKLRGVKKVTEESEYTSGQFKTSIDNIDKDIIKFISMVPTDSDIINYIRR